MASGSLGEAILFVWLDDSGQEGSVSSKSHNVGTKGTSECFWVNPVIFN